MHTLASAPLNSPSHPPNRRLCTPHTYIVAEERHSDSGAIIDVKFPVTTSKKLLTNNAGSLKAIGNNNKGQVRLFGYAASNVSTPNKVEEN